MRRLTPPLICLLCLLVLPAAAQAKVKVGFSEQQSAMFDDPLFEDLGTRQARLIVSYDAVLKNTFEVADIDQWMAGAKADGVRPLVSFNYSRGCFADGKIPNRPECKLPSVAHLHEGVQGVPQALPGREGHLALERDQPLLAADREEPEARGAVHDGGEEELPWLHHRGGRHARPGRDALLPEQVQAGAEGHVQGLGPAQLLGHESLPRQGHEELPAQRARAGVADRDRRRGDVRLELPLQRHPRGEGDEVHVQARRVQQADRAAVRLPVEWGRTPAIASTPASSARTARRARPTP